MKIRELKHNLKKCAGTYSKYTEVVAMSFSMLWHDFQLMKTNSLFEERRSYYLTEREQWTVRDFIIARIFILENFLLMVTLG